MKKDKSGSGEKEDTIEGKAVAEESVTSETEEPGASVQDKEEAERATVVTDQGSGLAAALLGRTAREKALLVTTFIAAIVAAVLFVRIGAVTADAALKVSQEKERSRLAAIEAERKSANAVSRAFASGAEQVFAMRSVYPDVTPRTFQAMCGDLAETGIVQHAMVLDSSRRVLGSTNLTEVGTVATLPEQAGSPPNKAMAEVKSGNTVLGYVLIVMK